MNDAMSILGFDPPTRGQHCNTTQTDKNSAKLATAKTHRHVSKSRSVSTVDFGLYLRGVLFPAWCSPCPADRGTGTLFGTWPQQQPGVSSPARHLPRRNARHRGRGVPCTPAAGSGAVARPPRRESPQPPPPAPRSRTDKPCSRALVPSAAAPTHAVDMVGDKWRSGRKGVTMSKTGAGHGGRLGSVDVVCDSACVPQKRPQYLGDYRKLIRSMKQHRSCHQTDPVRSRGENPTHKNHSHIYTTPTLGVA